MKRLLIILALPMLAACSPKNFTSLRSVENKDAAAPEPSPLIITSGTPAPAATPTPTATPPQVVVNPPPPPAVVVPQPPIVVAPPIVAPPQVAPPLAPPPRHHPPIIIGPPIVAPPVVVSTPAPTATPPGDPSAAVDTLCAAEGAASNNAAPVMLPFVPLGSINIPATCDNGFEVNNLRRGSIEINSLNSAGSEERELAIDLATYTAPDTVQILASDDQGNSKHLLYECRVRTADYPDPTRGLERPPEDSIRRWYVKLPAGTTHITVNNTQAFTPTYVRVLGLCDFNMNIDSGLPLNHYRIVP